jgi:hypothetical protein
MTEINHCAENIEPHQSYAIMLAKMLIIAMEDFAAIGMEDWSLRLRDGIEEIMARYGLRPEDIRVPRPRLHH